MIPRFPTPRPVRAFSLIEILIAVLILALGLLGLGALFPVVVREQRIGTDHVLGVLVTNNVRAALAQTDFDRLIPGWTIDTPARFWRDWRRHNPNQAELDRAAYAAGEWYVPSVDNRGQALYGDPNSNSQVRFPVAARLYPAITDAGGRPEFVWDLAVHRRPQFRQAPAIEGGSSVDKLDAVIFIRRLDPRIRVPAGSTRTDQILSGAAVPVGRIRNGVMPTLDGTDGAGGVAYSVPLIASAAGNDFQLSPATPRYINRIDLGRERGRLMAQPNQKLVDNMGNIYTVEAVEPDPGAPGYSRLRVSPPIPALLLRTTAPAGTPYTSQFIFTAQIPAGVAVVEVLP